MKRIRLILVLLLASLLGLQGGVVYAQVKGSPVNTVNAMDYYNPVAMLNEKTDESDVDSFNASVRATLNIVPVKGLKWDNFVSFNSERYEGREYLTKYYPSAVGEKGVLACQICSEKMDFVREHRK